MNWYIIIPVIVGIICLILGYLLGKLKKGNNVDHTVSYKKQISKLESDIAICKSK
jgi:hypothetical protein